MSRHNKKIRHEKKQWNVELIISVIIIMMSTLATTIPLYISAANTIKSVENEMKDFHGRLCAIEERNKFK